MKGSRLLDGSKLVDRSHPDPDISFGGDEEQRHALGAAANSESRRPFDPSFPPGHKVCLTLHEPEQLLGRGDRLSVRSLLHGPEKAVFLPNWRRGFPVPARWLACTAGEITRRQPNPLGSTGLLDLEQVELEGARTVQEGNKLAQWINNSIDGDDEAKLGGG